MSCLGLALFALGFATPVSAHKCPVASGTKEGVVGSCEFFKCSGARGPTHCVEGNCFCDEGFCRYPAESIQRVIKRRYCVQRVPDSTCYASGTCYKAGISSSFCEAGLCMCRWGYRINDDNQCVSPDAHLSLAASGNSTDISAEDREFLREQDKAIAINIAVFALWISGFLTALIGGAVLAYRKFHMQREETGYTEFLTCE